MYQEHSIQGQDHAGGDADRVGWSDGAERSKMPHEKSFYLHGPPGKQHASSPRKSGLLVFGALCYGEDRRAVQQIIERVVSRVWQSGRSTCLAERVWSSDYIRACIFEGEQVAWEMRLATLKGKERYQVMWEIKGRFLFLSCEGSLNVDS